MPLASLDDLRSWWAGTGADVAMGRVVRVYGSVGPRVGSRNAGTGCPNQTPCRAPIPSHPRSRRHLVSAHALRLGDFGQLLGWCSSTASSDVALLRVCDGFAVSRLDGGTYRALLSLVCYHISALAFAVSRSAGSVSAPAEYCCFLVRVLPRRIGAAIQLSASGRLDLWGAACR